MPGPRMSRGAATAASCGSSSCNQIGWFNHACTAWMYSTDGCVYQRPENHLPMQPHASPAPYWPPRSTVFSQVSLPS